jgi:hypothetical protein
LPRGADMHRRRRAGCVYELRPRTKEELRDLTPVRIQISEPVQTLPRYVQTRNPASGVIAYYWCRPWWARGADCPLKNEALGQYFDEVKVRAAILNAQLDSWRLTRKSPKPSPRDAKVAVVSKAEIPFGTTRDHGGWDLRRLYRYGSWRWPKKVRLFR